MLALSFLLAFGPADLAPAVQDLDAAWSRLVQLVSASQAAGTATLALQVEWTQRPLAKGTCDDHDRLALGWRIERFGTAWREATQAARIQADRVVSLRARPTVAPLVDERRRGEISALVAEVDAQTRAFLQASAWEVSYIRPVLAACPIAGVGLDLAARNAPVLARQDAVLPVAILAMADGFVCPGGIQAEEAVILVEHGQACWAADASCACTPQQVFPGAVLGPPIVEGKGDAEAAPAPVDGSPPP